MTKPLSRLLAVSGVLSCMPVAAVQAQQQLEGIVVQGGTQQAQQQTQTQGQPQPVAQPIDVDSAVAATQNAADPGSVYGAVNSTGAAARATRSATSPINPKQITPTSLQGFSQAASNITRTQLEERRARTRNEIFTRVPGMIVVNDDGNGNHGGLGAQGSPPRRSRKLLVMEDGQSVNLALWLDPSVHYMAPVDRIESVEVIRGGSVVHGPNNNYGIVNLRLLSPFGPNETVISGALGWTEPNGGNGDLYGLSNRRHVHTRQTFGNVGVVASYSGADVNGAWDQERLRFNDFYGALGWRGVDQDLTVQFTMARQRDVYDESNLEGDEDGKVGEVEKAFFSLNHCKTCYAPGSVFNNYNGDIYRGQITHNWYLNDDTTITTRVYAKRHRRDRYQIVSSEDNPGAVDDDERGIVPVFEDTDDAGIFNVLIPEGSMFGRLRTFRAIGGEVRGEWANLPLYGGMTHTIQAGVRYEYQDMTNRNFLGKSGQILEDGVNNGATIFERNLEADTFSSFLQSEVKVTRNFSAVPGVRFEWSRIKRQSLFTSEEEGEVEEIEAGSDEAEECEEELGVDECLELEGINASSFNESYDTGSILPGISFAYTGLYRTTFYGGYFRGLSTGVLRNEQFPAADELGDNYTIGVRSTAFKGLTFDVAYFHKDIRNYQFGQAFASTAGDRAFGRADEVEVNGVEMFGRLDSNPFHGGEWNLFGEANYTYNRSVFKSGTSGFSEDEDDPAEEVSIAGFRVPEVPLHVAALTAGIQQRPANGWNWDASVTFTYRGAFFTDEFNTGFPGDAEGENGEVPDVWLVSARASMDIGDTGASLWVAGENLTDELYITDREDGLKPGQARTFWMGAKYKF
jgi:Fe(3+) dicitrate transport protein